MDRNKILDDIEEIFEICQERNIGSNETELDIKETITDYIVKKLTLTDVGCSKRLNLVVFEDYTRYYKVSDEELEQLKNDGDIEKDDIVCKVEVIKEY